MNLILYATNNDTTTDHIYRYGTEYMAYIVIDTGCTVTLTRVNSMH
jgi:hypothetical protein